MNCKPPGSSVHGILQARIWIWVAMPSSRGSSRPKDWTHDSYVSCIDRQVLYHWSTRGAHMNYSVQSIIWSEVKVAQLCLTLCDPMEYTVHGILQARMLEWVAVLFRESSQPRDGTQVSCIAGGFFTSWATRETLKILEWAAYPFSSGSSRPYKPLKKEAFLSYYSYTHTYTHEYVCVYTHTHTHTHTHTNNRTGNPLFWEAYLIDCTLQFILKERREWDGQKLIP